MSTQNDFPDEMPVRQGMSSTAKVLLVLGSVAGFFLLACCGGVVLLVVKFQGAMQSMAQNLSTKDPDEIRARTAKIVHIDIPAEFPPVIAFDWFVMKQIIYGKQGRGSTVMIMEINSEMMGGKGAGNVREQRQEILRQLKQQQGQQGGNLDTDLAEERIDTREFEIDGEKVPFDFIKGRAANGGTAMRQVAGLFPGRQGILMLFVMVPESEYDEEAVVKMIESIRLPMVDDDAAEMIEDDAAEDSDMSRGAPALGGNDAAAGSPERVPDGPSAGGTPSEATP